MCLMNLELLFQVWGRFGGGKPHPLIDCLIIPAGCKGQSNHDGSTDIQLHSGLSYECSKEPMDMAEVWARGKYLKRNHCSVLGHSVSKLQEIL